MPVKQWCSRRRVAFVGSRWSGCRCWWRGRRGSLGDRVISVDSHSTGRGGVFARSTAADQRRHDGGEQGDGRRWRSSPTRFGRKNDGAGRPHVRVCGRRPHYVGATDWQLIAATWRSAKLATPSSNSRGGRQTAVTRPTDGRSLMMDAMRQCSLASYAVYPLLQTHTQCVEKSEYAEELQLNKLNHGRLYFRQSL